MGDAVFTKTTFSIQMMKLFSDELVTETVRDLDAALRGRGLQTEHEIQDGGNFLLLQVKVDDSLSEESLEGLLLDIKAAVGNKLPILGDDYAWCVAIVRGGDVIQSVLPDMGNFK